jgi:TIR domain
MTFLCHSSGDKEQVRALYWRLQSDGVRCWFDEEDLLPGQDWQHEIDKALEGSQYILVCISRSSVTKSGFLQREFRKALELADNQPEGSIFLIPVRLEVCEPPRSLQRWNWVDIFDENGYRQLLRVLQPQQHADLNTWQRITGRGTTNARSGIYISYRRTDEPGLVASLYDRLVVHFGVENVFIDVDSIELGMDSYEVRKRALSFCRVMLVIIGQAWLTATNLVGMRLLDTPDDYVRKEIEVALNTNVRIIPIVVGGAAPPSLDDLPESIRALGYRQATAIHDQEPDFRRLITILKLTSP